MKAFKKKRMWEIVVNNAVIREGKLRRVERNSHSNVQGSVLEF